MGDLDQRARQKGEWVSQDPLWKKVRYLCANCEHPKGYRGACPDCIYRLVRAVEAATWEEAEAFMRAKCGRGNAIRCGEVGVKDLATCNACEDADEFRHRAGRTP